MGSSSAFGRGWACCPFLTHSIRSRVGLLPARIGTNLKPPKLAAFLSYSCVLYLLIPYTCNKNRVIHLSIHFLPRTTASITPTRTCICSSSSTGASVQAAQSMGTRLEASQQQPLSLFHSLFLFFPSLPNASSSSSFQLQVCGYARKAL